MGVISKSGVVLAYRDGDLGGSGCSSWLVGVVLPHSDGDMGG